MRPLDALAFGVLGRVYPFHHPRAPGAAWSRDIGIAAHGGVGVLKGHQACTTLYRPARVTALS